MLNEDLGCLYSFSSIVKVTDRGG